MIPTEKVIANYVEIGHSKAQNSPTNLFLLAIMAGFFISFAGVAANTSCCTIENASIAKMVSAAVFPAGLAMVLCASSELFTGDCLMILSVLNKKITLSQLTNVLIIVYIGNFVGSFLVAYAVNFTDQIGAFGGQLAVYSIKVASAKVNMDFMQSVVLGIMCNFLVCIGVVMGLSATSVPGKIIGGFVPVYAFVVAGYEHSVANMYFISSGLIAAKNPAYASLATSAGIDMTNLNIAGFAQNLIPVTIGNIIGAMVFVALIYQLVFLKE